MMAVSAARHYVRGILFCLFVVAGPNIAFGQSHDSIVENCRQTAGRPFVQSCMGGARGDSGMLEKCRAQASPKVRACVLAAEQKIAAGKAAPAAPKDDKPSVAASAIAAIKAIFVAPPRNISDITAILDQEKPDAGKIA